MKYLPYNEPIVAHPTASAGCGVIEFELQRIVKPTLQPKSFWAGRWTIHKRFAREPDNHSGARAKTELTTNKN